MVVVERQFDFPRSVVFRAWTAPEEMARWRGSPGWHVEADTIPSSRYGVYMGIINMMIVVPMLVQTLTFGWIFEHVLGDDASNAIIFAGILLACAAAAMSWIKEPPIVRQVDDILTTPAGGSRGATRWSAS
jgi:hypothetical protein